MAAVLEMIAQIVLRMGLAFNIHPLNAIEGNHVLKKQLLIGGSSTPPISSNLQ